ncbi:ATP-grasp domain-containing protein [Streptomyces sp. NPDC002130]|uniref:ATP-grasp domain-containing protein n=1 Tax=Streptomyces sp. NPDC002130 TaxID=3155568 RepID=UPI0033167F7D
MELGHLTPALVDDATLKNVEAYVGDVVRAVGITSGPFHCELRLTADGPVLIEIGARLPSDRTVELLRIVTGVSLPRVAVTPSGAARMLRWAGWALGASCLVFAVSGGHGALLDSAALLGGALVLVLGELYQASASWGLSFGLVPAGRQGEYQAVFSLERGLQQFAGPCSGSPRRRWCAAWRRPARGRSRRRPERTGRRPSGPHVSHPYDRDR